MLKGDRQWIRHDHIFFSFNKKSRPPPMAQVIKMMSGPMV